MSVVWGAADPWEKVEWGRHFCPANYPSIQEYIELPGVGHCPMVRGDPELDGTPRFSEAFDAPSLQAVHPCSRLLVARRYICAALWCVSGAIADVTCVQDEAPQLVNPLIQKFIDRHTAAA